VTALAWEGENFGSPFFLGNGIGFNRDGIGFNRDKKLKGKGDTRSLLSFKRDIFIII